MRKRIVRLTESGLTRLVKRIINEQENDYTLPLNGPGRAFLEGATSNEVYEFLSDLPSDTQFLALIISVNLSELILLSFAQYLL